MRILVVSNLFPPIVYGGYEILCEQVVGRFRSRGHRVRVLTSAFGAERAPRDPETVRSLELTTPFPRPGENVGTVDFRLATLERVAQVNRRETLAELDGHRPDLVFLWCQNRLSLGPLLAARERGIPVAWAVNDEHPRQFRVARPGTANPREMARWVAERWAWPHATLAATEAVPMAVISAHLRRSLQRLGVPMDAARVIHQGIPLERFPFRPRMRGQGEPLRVLYVGQLSRVKGVHTAIRGVAVAARERGVDARLTIVGTGVPAYESELRGQAAREAPGRVEFRGFLSHDRIAESLHDHHVLVFPSEWDEPFGLAHLEAMACGAAVVSTTTGGSAELIRHGSNALAFSAGDARELAFRLGEIDRDEPRRLRLIRNARAWVHEHHSLDGYVRTLDEFLESVHEAGPLARLDATG